MNDTSFFGSSRVSLRPEVSNGSKSDTLSRPRSGLEIFLASVDRLKKEATVSSKPAKESTAHSIRLSKPSGLEVSNLGKFSSFLNPTSFTKDTSRANRPLGNKPASDSARRWFSSGFLDDDGPTLTKKTVSRTAFSLKKEDSTTYRGKVKCTTTHEIASIPRSDDNNEDNDDGDEDDELDDEAGGEEEEEGDDEEDNDEDEDNDNHRQGYTKLTSPKIMSCKFGGVNVRPLRKQVGTSATNVSTKLQRPGYKTVKLPNSFKAWMGSTKGPSAPLEQEPETCLVNKPLQALEKKQEGATDEMSLFPPSPQPKQVESTRKIPLPSVTTNPSIDEDIRLFESIKAKAVVPKPTALLLPCLPEPDQIRAATKQSQKSVGRRIQKRRTWEPVPMLPAKKAKWEENEQRNIVFKIKNESRPNQGDEDDEDDLRPDRSVNQDQNSNDDANREPWPMSLPAPPLRAPSPPPISDSRIVMQYTAFRSHRLDGQADSTLAGKMIRLESFLDKRKANKCAEGHMPKSNPAIARMEFDYGGDGSGRNGMFFGRIFYTDGTHVLIYVDCEYQEFGQVDQAEISGKSINPRFKDLCLTSKYDVFVFQYKKVDSKDGTFVIVKYDETPKPTVAEIEEEDSEDDEENEKKRDSDDSTKDEVCQVETSALQEGLVDPEDKDNGNGDPNDVHVDEHKNDSTQDIDDQNKQDHEHRCENTNSHQYDEDDIEEVDRHFASDFVGSYTTLAEANKKAIETFALLTRPRYPARMDAIIFYRDVLQPSIEEKRRELLEDLDAKDATRKAEIVWAPNPQFQYDYEAILVLVAESKIQGPLDLTGAFD